MAFSSRRAGRARARHLAAALLALALFGATVGDARADAASDAVRLYDQSSEAYKSGHFREAVKLLEQAYALKPDPVLLYNIGRAEEGVGDYRLALNAYERYLKEASEIPDRPGIERRIATLRQQIAAQGERERLRDERDREARTAKILPWILVGLGGATLAGATVFGILAHSAASDAKTEPVQRTANDEGSTAKTRSVIANVGFIAGGALTAGGLAWVVVRATTKSTSAASSATPTAARLVLAPRVAGIALALTLDP